MISEDRAGKPKVSRVFEDKYFVVGDTDEHIVYKDVKGDSTWKCDCRGFRTKGRCSHQIAVLLTENEREELNRILKIQKG